MQELCTSASKHESEATAPGVVPGSLRVRTLELLWHCRESDGEFQQLGLHGATIAEGITSIDYTSFRNRLVTTGGDQCIRVWQLDDCAIGAWLSNPFSDMTQCSKHISRMTPIWMPLTARWAPQGTMIASGHCEGKICLWCDTEASDRRNTEDALNRCGDGPREEWKEYRHLDGHLSDVYDLVFSPDSRYLFSGASNGSIAIHDLESGIMPVVYLSNQHGKFCCGVAWDPWNVYVHSFGACPALQFYTNVIPRRDGDRLHLASQRRCEGDFLSEPYALSFRRLSWSPDGLFLAVPYGKAVHKPHIRTTSRQGAGTLSAFSPMGPNLRDKDQKYGESVLGVGIKRVYENEEALSETNARMGTDNDSKKTVPKRDVGLDGKARRSDFVNKSNEMNHSLIYCNEEEEKKMMHCVNIYLRNALDKLAARLVVRGYNELRGVQWAPCFLEPLKPKEPLPLVLKDFQESDITGTDLPPCSRELKDKLNCKDSLESSDLRVADNVKVDGVKQIIAPAEVSGGWGPGDYRMVLAVWTCDSVLVYTTDSCTRHSDFTDLHARNITDVTWSKNARFLYTASLDGYISVISFGTSLTLAHRFPTFSDRAVTKSLTAMLQQIQRSRDIDRACKSAMEGKRSSRATIQSDIMVAAVRKKKKIETTGSNPDSTIIDTCSN